MKREINNYRTEKGQGGHTSMQLTADQKVALTLWIHKNEDLCKSHSSFELADKFKSESGIIVSSSSIITTRNAVFPSMKRTRSRSKSSPFDHNLFIEKMNQLNARISKIESELGMLSI
jgi:hypothetical protein